jgi:O-antigen/teichoic acid export membrane protein
MGQQRSVMVAGAIWLTAGAVGLAGLATLFTIVFKDELVDGWAAGRTGDTGSVTPPAFVPVSVTMFFVVAMLTFVVVAFFRQGHGWARVMLSLIAVVLAAATLAVLRTDPPMLFLGVAIVSLVVDVAAVAALWHKDTRAFCDEPADLSRR